MVREIPVKGGYAAIVDDEDYERLAAFRWSAVKGRRGAIYAARTVKARDGEGKPRVLCRQMQRDVLDPDMTLPRSIKSDHLNHDTLDNRRCNLRLVDCRVSMLNRRLFLNNKSGFRGVYRETHTRRFRANIMSNGIRYTAPARDTAVEAALDYNRLAMKYHGDHAMLNVIADGEM